MTSARFSLRRAFGCAGCRPKSCLAVAGLLLVFGWNEGACLAVTLAQYAKEHPIKLFTATKGAEMPNSIDAPEHLKEGYKALSLSGKGLTDLVGISKLIVEDDGKKVPVTSVRNLFLYTNQNQIANLPDEIGSLKNVIFFYCEQNKLSTLPRTMMEMDSLIAMYLTANEFREIPSFVFNMTRLRKLQFARNRIAVLPPEIGRLTELRHFNIAGNQIRVLPESIANLVRLRVCDLSDNCLASLPEAFGQVPIVNQLRVRNNPLTSLPAGFVTMRATIDITGTKIDPAKLLPEMRTKISTEKPPGSKDEDAIIVTRPKRP